MTRSFTIATIIVVVLIVLQLVVVPLIAINSVVPNIVLIFLILFVLRFGQIPGIVFAFLIGIFYDLFSGGLIGSSMFAYTLSVFIAGYFYKENFKEVIFNMKIYLLIVFIAGTIFAISYSVLGIPEQSSQINMSIIFYGISCGAYTTLLSLIIYLIPKERL